MTQKFTKYYCGKTRVFATEFVFGFFCTEDNIRIEAISDFE